MIVNCLPYRIVREVGDNSDLGYKWLQHWLLLLTKIIQQLKSLTFCSNDLGKYMYIDMYLFGQF